MKKVDIDDTNFSFVADRSLLDHWAYCLQYCAGFMTNEEFLAMENLVRKHMRSSYSHIFYFPFGYWFAEGDGVRQDSYAWQSSIDAIIMGYIIRWNLPVFTVPQTDGENARNEFVLNVLAETVGRK
jgi:hypothetical protein